MSVAVDRTGTSFLVVAIGVGEGTGVVGAWVAEAEAMAPTRLLVLDTLTDPCDRATLAGAVGGLRVGARIVVAGGRYDVLQACAICREYGVLPAELVAVTTHERDLPVYCAHCRATHRVEGEPGGEVRCPGCGRHLEVHDHTSTVLGAYLASDARATELVS